MQRSTFLVAATVLSAFAVFVLLLPVVVSQRINDKISKTILGSQTKSLNCRAAYSLPDPECTPGQIVEKLTKQEICSPDYLAAINEVSQGLANQVYLQYGIVGPEPGQYQIDRLVSEKLGGSNDISNLWPQPADPRPGFHEKDRVESYLYDEVCAGRMTLKDAQDSLSSSWVKVFLSMPSY